MLRRQGLLLGQLGRWYVDNLDTKIQSMLCFSSLFGNVSCPYGSRPVGPCVTLLCFLCVCPFHVQAQLPRKGRYSLGGPVAADFSCHLVSTL